MFLVHFVHHSANVQDSTPFELSKVHMPGPTNISDIFLQYRWWCFPCPVRLLYIPSRSFWFFYKKKSINFPLLSSLLLFEWLSKHSTIPMIVQASVLQQTITQLVPTRFLCLFIPFFPLASLKGSSEWFIVYLLFDHRRWCRLKCTCQSQLNLNM